MKTLKYDDWGNFIQMSKEDWETLKRWFSRNSTLRLVESPKRVTQKKRKEPT